MPHFNSLAMRTNFKLKIEEAFGIPFDQVILDLHWKKNLSVNEIAKRAGISHTPVITLCRKYGLKLRNQSQASAINMKKNNPMHVNEAAEKRAKTIQKTFFKKLLPQEKQFKDFLDMLGLKYEAQFPIGPYNIDFFIPEGRFCLEIDSLYKMTRERRKAMVRRDAYLNSLGYHVIRLNKVWLPNLLDFAKIISLKIPHLNCPR